jgi:hypothetical protein
MIFIQAATQAEVPNAIRQATDTLVRRHQIKRGAVKDFDVHNLSQFVETAESSSRIIPPRASWRSLPRSDHLG